MAETAAPSTRAPTGASSTTVHQTGTSTIDTPLPTAPPGSPKYGPGSATELRRQQEQVQKQLDDLLARIAARDQQHAGEEDYTPGPRESEQKAIDALNTRLTTLAQNIQAAESRVPTVIGGNDPSEKFIVRQNPDGTIDTSLNPNWDHKAEKAQTISMGNRIFTVSPEGKVTVAYTDQDAADLAQRQTNVAEKNAATAAAAQATNDYATRARVELEERVSKGEDAASVRAEQALELQRLHQEWVQADGDARRAQEELRDYETNRHNTATEKLSQDQLQATREFQKQQDETLRRGQDLQQQQAQMQARTSLANQRLSTGAGYTGNVLSTLAQLNRDAPPGSSAIGEMLLPLLTLGQNFFSALGGLDSPESIVAGQGAAAAGQPAAAAANPVIPGTAVPGVTPAAAAAQAASTPLAPDGSPYVTPDVVAQKLAERRGQAPISGTQALDDPYGRMG